MLKQEIFLSDPIVPQKYSGNAEAIEGYCRQYLFCRNAGFTEIKSVEAAEKVAEKAMEEK